MNRNLTRDIFINNKSISFKSISVQKCIDRERKKKKKLKGLEVGGGGSGGGYGGSVVANRTTVVATIRRGKKN